MSLRLLVGIFAVLLVCGCESPRHSGGYLHPKPPQRVVSLSPSTTELLGIHLPYGALVGRTSSCNYPGNVETAAVVGDVKPNYEKIASLKPDLIFYDASLYNDQEVEKMRALGVDLFPLEVDSVDRYLLFLDALGSRIDQPMKIAEYSDKVFNARKVALSSPPNPRPKVAVLLAGNGYMISGTKGFLADCIRAAGGDPVGPDTDKFETANLEALISWNPDVIVVGASPDQMTTDTSGMSDEDPTEADAVLRDARLKPIKAIKNGAVAAINQDILLRAGSRVDKLISNLYQFFLATSKP
ncbi:MAG: High-affinity heme uptake system protein IsdE [Fimbriimonadaceae bacterium]|nr:High-affinity heme uptake system protein IsdE [Fimbriimonadaceae bacterium]